ncbi:phosphoglycolate phosphatase [Fulvimarina manganoxydans]|uniref:Phosphoglycolate phosphatase n=1 Tax=Fulvimarina manganoxydans TaxID=937218 RepID=A0A1W2D7S9_9HYPH|nr:HAD family hydrolase [Fulvimarina manganoxydans]SMC93264.1 phosphoglycolate phosphatase [Fulvimarina manganoxydans]
MDEAVEGILFDKDGTLIDYAASWLPINREAAHCAAGGDPERAAHLLTIGGHDSETNRVAADSLLAASNTAEIAAAWVEAGSPFDVEALTRELDRIFTAGSSAAVPVPGIADLFDRLRRTGLRLGVATSDSVASAQKTLETIGLTADFVAGYDSGYGAKPGTGMALAFAETFALSPSNCIMVGDNLHDIRMGRAAGFGLCVGVMTGTGNRADLTREADHVLEAATALPDLLAFATQDAATS